LNSSVLLGSAFLSGLIFRLKEGDFKMQKRNLLKNLWIIFIGLVLTAGSSALATVQSSTTNAEKAG